MEFADLRPGRLKETFAAYGKMGFRNVLSTIDMYSYIGIFLVILIAVNSMKFGLMKTIPQVLIAVAVASLLDIAWKYFKTRRWIVPRTGAITGLLIGAVLAEGQVWYVPTVAAAIAVLSKALIRIEGKHIFNPAATGIVISALLFGTVTGWWAALPLWLVALFGAGLMLKMRNYFQLASFLISYVIIIGTMQFFSAGLTLDVLALNSSLIFFTFFMFTEPKTSPYTRNGKIIYGVLTAALVVVFGLYVAQADNMLLGLLAGNATVPLIRKFLK